MNINTFGKYNVKLFNRYTYISDYDYEMKDPIFSEDIEEWEKIMDGGDLMQFLARILLEYDTITFECKNLSIEHREPVGGIIIEKFDPQNGTGATITINYRAIK